MAKSTEQDGTYQRLQNLYVVRGYLHPILDKAEWDSVVLKIADLEDKLGLSEEEYDQLCDEALDDR